MNKAGPVVIIEDDPDDQELLTMVFTDLGYKNEIVFISDADKAIDYLTQTHIVPFLVLSDVHMPRLNGFELRQRVKENAELTIKCIPYLFFTTSASEQSVYKAYSTSVQGFFVKPDNYEEIREDIRIIMEYWRRCYSPNNYGYNASVKAYDAKKKAIVL